MASKKTKPGPAPTWALPHGEGQGPRPGNHTLPPIKKAKFKRDPRTEANA